MIRFHPWPFTSLYSYITISVLEDFTLTFFQIVMFVDLMYWHCIKKFSFYINFCWVTNIEKYTAHGVMHKQTKALLLCPILSQVTYQTTWPRLRTYVTRAVISASDFLSDGGLLKSSCISVSIIVASPVNTIVHHWMQHRSNTGIFSIWRCCRSRRHRTHNFWKT